MRAKCAFLLLFAGVCLHCSTEDSAPATPSPYDDDSARLLHCKLEPAPAQETRPPPTPTEVRAGIASRVLDLPIGSPMGGYGARSTTFGGDGQNIKLDERVARFATRFIPSAGAHDAPRVDGIALEVEGERLVILQTDAILFTETALFALEQALAPDGSMRGHVIVAASHSHASPSNWLPSFSLVPGIDRPHQGLFERAIVVHAEAAKAALAALEPARIGFAIDENADPTNAISHDRRGENNDLIAPDGNTAGKDKDHFVWTMRVDHADGTPMAALLSFPIHGTVGTEESPLFSSDAPGAIERSLSSALGYPVFHLQGAGGDVSPGGSPGRTACPDGARCLDIPNLEIIGALAKDAFLPLIQGVTTEDRLAVEVVTRTVYVGHAGVVTRPDGKKLYYPPPGDYIPDGQVFEPDGSLASPLDEFNAPGGAALCGSLGQGALLPIAGTEQAGAYSSCHDIEKLGPTVGGLYQLPAFETPICDTSRATVSVVRFDTGVGGPLLLVTIPGEPTAPYSAYLRGRSPAGAGRTLILGYAQDYIGYVLTAEDWLAGGYEPSLNVWGPLEGEMVLDGILEAAAIAWSVEKEDPEAGTSRVSHFPFAATDPLIPLVTTDHGTVPESLPKTLFLPDTTSVPAHAQPDPIVPRAVGVARFVWLGGDPTIDFPRVVVEREITPGSFLPVVGVTQEAASSENGTVVITYTPDPIDAAAPSQHFYAATWQPVPPDPYVLELPARPFALEPGVYRLVATGRARAESGEVTYSIASAPFQVTSAPLASGSAKPSATALEIQALLGTAPGLRALGTGASDMNIVLPGPWTAVVTFEDATTKSTTITPASDGNGVFPLNAVELASAVSVEVRDAAGNGDVLPVQ